MDATNTSTTENGIIHSIWMPLILQQQKMALKSSMVHIPLKNLQNQLSNRSANDTMFKRPPILSIK